MMSRSDNSAACDLRGSRSVVLGLAALVLLASMSVAGCSKPLLSPDEPRTQFDRYDAIRNQYAPQYTEDPFGRRHPNLRARLTPRE